MIVACDLNGLIGYDGKLLWHNKTDLERFKELTMGGTLIMGRKTYESLPINADGRRLTGRLKHVLSKSWPTKESTDDTKWFRDWDRALLESPRDKNHNRNIWIIGGASIYQEALLLGIPDFIDITIMNFVYLPPVSDSLHESKQKSSKLEPIPMIIHYGTEGISDDRRIWHIIS